MDARLVLERGLGQRGRHGCLALGLQTEQLLQLRNGISRVWPQGIGQMRPAGPISHALLDLLLLQLLAVLSLCSRWG